MVIFDTSVIIDHLRQVSAITTPTLFERAVENLMHQETLGISLITLQELYQGKSTSQEDTEQSLLSTISVLSILPYNYQVAELAGKIARDRASFIEFADAAIAATAIVNEAKLLTLNDKHFVHIPNLDLLPLSRFKGN